MVVNLHVLCNTSLTFMRQIAFMTIEVTKHLHKRSWYAHSLSHSFYRFTLWTVSLVGISGSEVSSWFEPLQPATEKSNFSIE